MGGMYSMHMEDVKCVQNIRQSQVKRSLGRPRHKCEDDIKMDLRKKKFGSTGSG
jgi:hypothetical protein